MKQLTLRVSEGYYKRLLMFLQTLDYVQISEEETSKPQEESEPASYDFSDVIGKLSWKGDAVLEQRKLRDEW